MENELNGLEKWRKLHTFYIYSDFLTKDLAAYLQVSPRTIQRWLKGKAHPSEEKLILINKFMDEKLKEKTLDQDLA